MAPSASPIPGKPPVLLVSACLAGEPVRYNNTAAPLDAPLRTQIQKWIANQRAIALCPEIEGGLSCPRPCAEIRGKGGGHGILTGEATIVDKGGNPLTRAFLNGCRQVTKEAVSLGISIAFLKEQSPSCGVHRIYDGRFSGNKKPGSGLLTALLQKAGIRVISEEETDLLLYLMEKNRSEPETGKTFP